MITRKRIGHLLGLLFLLLFISEESFALVITSPKEGDHFKEGDTINVVADLSPDDPEVFYVHLNISAPVRGCRDISTHPRYECTFKIPSNSPPEVVIFASAKTANGVIEAERIKVLVSLPASVTLRELWVRDDQKREYMYVGAKRKLYVSGLYSDGVKRSLGSSKVGTTFKSSDPKIASVDTEGLVTAIAHGKVDIIVTNKEHSLTTKVEVEEAKPRK
jgi:hypothetical protein